VTVLFQAAGDDTSTDYSPLAVLSVARPVQVGRAYPVTPQAAGVGGWVSFGSGANGEPWSGRFSRAGQSRLTSRAGKPYRPLPVLSVQALNADARLTGLVTLRAEAPLSLTKEERDVDGALRDCIVVRLVETAGVDGFPVPTDLAVGETQQSVFQLFAGPCSGRPEAGTCGCPQPLQFVNAVAPDCDGVLTIEFRGCANIASITETSGVAVSCALGLTDTCLPLHIPGSDGRLPDEYVPVPVSPPPPVVPPVPPPDTVDPTPVPTPGDAPLVECFRSEAGVSLTTRSGAFAWYEDDQTTPWCPYAGSDSISDSTSLSGTPGGGSYQTTTAATRNVATLDEDVSAVNREAAAAVRMLPGPSGAKNNGGLVFNWRGTTYYVAEVDYDTQVFRLSRFNGTTFQEIAAASVPGLQLDKWYRITVRVVPFDVYGAVTVQARVVSLTDLGVTDATITVNLNNYQPANGKFGLGSNRALARFAYLRVEEYP